MDLKSKTDKIGLVVNPKKESTNPAKELALLQSKVVKSKNFVATIIHDRDLLENGELKTMHLHIYMELPKKCTLKAILSDFSQEYDLLLEQVSIMATNNDYLLVQYLTHKNDQDKTQYSIDNIKTNNKDSMLVKWNKTYKTEEEIKLEILAESKTTEFLELAKIYGVNQVNSLRGLIKDIRSEDKGTAKDLTRRLTIANSYCSDLADLLERFIRNCEFNLSESERKLINLNDLKTEYESIVNFYDKR